MKWNEWKSQHQFGDAKCCVWSELSTINIICCVCVFFSLPIFVNLIINSIEIQIYIANEWLNEIILNLFSRKCKQKNWYLKSNEHNWKANQFISDSIQKIILLKVYVFCEWKKKKTEQKLRRCTWKSEHSNGCNRNAW